MQTLQNAIAEDASISRTSHRRRRRHQAGARGVEEETASPGPPLLLRQEIRNFACHIPETLNNTQHFHPLRLQDLQD